MFFKKKSKNNPLKIGIKFYFSDKKELEKILEKASLERLLPFAPKKVTILDDLSWAEVDNLFNSLEESKIW